jgi:hypothetical protein
VQLCQVAPQDACLYPTSYCLEGGVTSDVSALVETHEATIDFLQGSRSFSQPKALISSPFFAFQKGPLEIGNQLRPVLHEVVKARIISQLWSFAQETRQKSSIGHVPVLSVRQGRDRGTGGQC